MLKVFYTAPSKQFESMQSIYTEIKRILVERLNTQLTWDFVGTTLEKLRNNIRELSKEEWKKIYKGLIDALLEADIAIFENTISSFSTGYLAGVAISKEIPTLVLMDKKVQHTFKGSFIEGITSPYLTVVHYSSLNDLYNAIKNFVDIHSDPSKATSFHLKLTKSEKLFIDHMSQKLGVSKIDFIRALLAKEMMKKKE